jgi:hypothetical protein
MLFIMLSRADCLFARVITFKINYSGLHSLERSSIGDTVTQQLILINMKDIRQ